jgi:O-succinylbenzoic acid--CoA ligase
MFDFKSSSNLYLFNPKLETTKLKSHLKALGLDSHIFILSSGTTMQGGLKGYALSKDAILANAKAVNQHLSLTQDDTWLCSLPHYHIGGLSIYARASLSGAKVKEFHQRWNVEKFYNQLENIQVCSAVPLQCYDLVQSGYEAPKSLKYLIVGGDFLPEHIHKKLIQLKWPVIRTYGMTEVCSQLATETQISDELKLKPLSVHDVFIKNGVFSIKSTALYTGEFKLNGTEFSYTPLTTNTFHTNDLGEIKDGFIYPLGRKDQDFKIKGRRVDFFELKKLVSNLAAKHNLYKELNLKKVRDERDGYALNLEYSCKNLPEAFKSELELVLKPVAIKSYKPIESIDRTELGKIKTD